MKIAYTVLDLRSLITEKKSKNNTVGFVPTMGALHAGHLSLVEESKKDNDITIVSIFVNPTQFNNLSDLEKYPRTIDDDTKLLANAGVDIVFIPSVEEIYPEPDTRVFNFGKLEEVMEGKFRPGHFNGVAQVVSKLFDIVNPDKAYFGEKDFQQLAIIRDMVRQYNYSIEIVAVPIKREVSGLAMSSRNKRLSENELVIASNVYRALEESKINIARSSVNETIRTVISHIDNIDPLKVEYFEIVNGDSLQPVKDWTESDYIVGCITVFCGDVRLIDNITYKNKQQK